MRRFHVIGGLPRAGSTLLCNILNQNPTFHASDTSPLSSGIASILSTLVSRPEHTSEHHVDADRTTARLQGVVRGCVEGWYSPISKEKEVIFDKDRSNTWVYQYDILRESLPNAKILCTVRDPRAVVASAIRRQNKNPFVRLSPAPAARTLNARVSGLIQPGGLVWSSITAIENTVLDSNTDSPKSDHILLIPYEELTKDPKNSMKSIYAQLGEPLFEHDFDNVINVSKDLDALYKGLWPHEGSGKVESRNSHWSDVLPPGVADSIIKSFPVFCSFFGYK